jgi:RNA polymerase sigma factor (sigma-70 family)
VTDELADGELVARLQHDPESLSCFYRRHVAAVERYAVRRCAQPADVGDLVAETFLTALRSASSFDRRRGDALPWLLGIAHHLLVRSFAEGARQDAITRRLAHRRTIEPMDLDRLEEAIDAAREVREVEAVLATLPLSQREVLWLVGYDGLSPEQAAQALSVSVPTFRVRLHRARRALRQGLTDYGRFHPLVVTASKERPL